MRIETTLNIKIHLLDKINYAAKYHGIHRIELIILLFKMVMKDAPKYIRYGKRVEYQSRHNNGAWHAFHIQLRPNDYECFLDLRKLLKMSVSNILAFAIDKYLDILMRKRVTDNYHITNYLILKETIDGIQCWKIIWGFPRNFDMLIHDY
jgi:hypothetical protein